MREREDREKAEAEETARLALIASHNAKLKSLSIPELRAEAKRVLALREPEVKVTVPYTKSQIKAMDPKTLRSLMTYPNGQRREGVSEEITRILNSPDEVAQ
jgi:hypothetical protein